MTEKKLKELLPKPLWTRRIFGGRGIRPWLLDRVGSKFAEQL